VVNIALFAPLPLVIPISLCLFEPMGLCLAPMTTRVKICGLTRPGDVSAAIDAGAAFLGFIVECPSKRRLSVAEAARLAPSRLSAARVAVTVNPSDDLIARIMAEMKPDYIQLHGDETPYDAKPPKGESVRGGHGIAIDWNIIARAPTPKIFAVAGGLTPDNVAHAMTATRAPILDVSSGVEASAGVKDTLKITAFMKAVEHG